jgi:hypothetical protein
MRDHLGVKTALTPAHFFSQVRRVVVLRSSVAGAGSPQAMCRVAVAGKAARTLCVPGMTIVMTPDVARRGYNTNHPRGLQSARCCCCGTRRARPGPSTRRAPSGSASASSEWQRGR